MAKRRLIGGKLNENQISLLLNCDTEESDNEIILSESKDSEDELFRDDRPFDLPKKAPKGHEADDEDTDDDYAAEELDSDSDVEPEPQKPQEPPVPTTPTVVQDDDAETMTATTRLTRSASTANGASAASAASAESAASAASTESADPVPSTSTGTIQEPQQQAVISETPTAR